MSMKRTKQAARGRSKDDESLAPWNRKQPEKTYTFAEDVAAQPEESFVPYSLKSRYGKGALLLHPKFGRGVVTTVEGSRVDVLFEDGTKKLGHGG
jgi:hypothetical protein